MSHYNSFVDSLRKRLSQDLPGYEAHRTMMRHRRALHEIKNEVKKARQSAVLLLVYPKYNELHTVFIKRPAYDGVHSGQIALPGGKVEDFDLDLKDTALREANEELGIIRDKVEILGSLSPLYIPPSNFMVHPYIAYTEHIHQYIPDPLEVESFIEIPLLDFTRPNFLEDLTISVGAKQKLSVKAFNMNGEIIWGATSMIMAEMAMLLKELNE